MTQNPAFRILYWTFGLVPIVAGLDKFTNLLADWSAYVSPMAAAMIPFDTGTFMMIVGVIEIAAGIMVLRLPRVGSLIVAVWLVLIAVNLILAGHFDVAVRDLVMALAAFALFHLNEPPVVRTT